MEKAVELIAEKTAKKGAGKKAGGRKKA